MNKRFGLPASAFFALLQACHSAGPAPILPSTTQSFAQQSVTFTGCGATYVAGPALSNKTLAGVVAFASNSSMAVGTATYAQRYNGG
jgi:NADH:ubiquinone oxidoreductase subunit 4 (subunit M)